MLKALLLRIEIFIGVIKCKNEEKESINYVDQCKAQLKCGGAGSKEEGEELLQTLTP